MKNHLMLGSKIFFTVLFSLSLFLFPSSATAESSIPQTDQTPLAPLTSPPSPAQPRYLSGFGLDNAYTVFYEDRNDKVGCPTTGPYQESPGVSSAYAMYYDQTTSGPFGFATSPTRTDICETHFTVKDWPITIGAITYAYRGWGSVGNNPWHSFFVSNNLTYWTQIYLGTGMFSDPLNVMLGETINYGFHDIIQLNGKYLGFAESAGGNTYIVSSNAGDEHWTVLAKVGGSEIGDGPLTLSFTSAGPIPTGNFLLMEIDGEMVYGKLMIAGARNGAFLAINKSAAQPATPALAEAAFVNPSNWTWRDGTSWVAPGAANTVLSPTASHGISEVWTVPTSDYRADLVILYTASYSGTRGIGCAASSSQCLVVLPSAAQVAAPSIPKAIPFTGFTPNRVTALHTQVREYAVLGDLWLEIPSLGISTPIVGVPQSNGTWDVSWLGKDAGWLNGSAFPTWAGNSVLTGHVFDAFGKPGPFAGINRLWYGSRIIVHAWGGEYIYEVRSIMQVDPGNTSAMMKHQDLPWLTLVTCRGYNEATDSYKYRVLVRAVLVDVK